MPWSEGTPSLCCFAQAPFGHIRLGVDGAFGLDKPVGHNHHFKNHCNSIGVIWVCTAHWTWCGTFHWWHRAKSLLTVADVTGSGSTARYAPSACHHEGGTSAAWGIQGTHSATLARSCRVVAWGKEGVEGVLSESFIVERTKVDFSRPRKVEPPSPRPIKAARRGNGTGLQEPEKFELSTGVWTLGCRSSKKLELRPLLP